MAAAGAADLSVEDLVAGYAGRPVIRGLTLRPIRAGQVTALVGPNAAGKSTLLRAMAGLLPARGALRLGGRDLLGAGLAERARHVAFMPQELPRGVALTVLEGVLGALRAAPAGAAADAAGDDPRRRGVAALARLGIADLAMVPLDRLSGGQRQMAGLAQAVARQPAVLLLDEPTSALDLRHQVAVMRILRGLAAEGRVVVAVLHDLSLAARWADQIVVLADGRVHAEGPPAEAVTAGMLAAVYGVRARVERCSRGTLTVIVDDDADPAAPASSPREVP